MALKSKTRKTNKAKRTGIEKLKEREITIPETRKKTVTKKKP